MPLTNFPNGVSSFGVPQLGGGPVFTTGNVYFVQSTGSLASDNPSSGTKEQPFATIAYAITQCTASNGDVILVMPGHAEVVTDTTDGLDVDIAGLRIVGVPSGGLKPSITIDAASSFIDMAVDGVTLENLRILAGAADVSVAVYVTGNDCAILNCDFLETTTNENFQQCVDGFGGADRCRVIGNRIIQPDAANTLGVRTGTGDGWLVADNHFCGDWGTGAIYVGATTNAGTNATIINNTIYNAASDNDSCVDTAAASTGIIAYTAAAGGAAQGNGIDPGACGAVENYYVDAAANASGILDPIAT